MTTPRSPFVPLLPLLLFLSVAVQAQDAGNEEGRDDAGPAQPLNSEASLFVGNPHPQLLPELKVEGYDYLEGSISVENEGALVSWAPFLLQPEYKWWSETRFQLSQADDVTSLGMSLKYNPLHPRSSNGDAIWNDLALKLSDPVGLQTVKEKRIAELKKRISEELTRSASGTCSMAGDELVRLVRVARESKEEPIGGDDLLKARCIVRDLPYQIEKREHELESASDADDKQRLTSELESLGEVKAVLWPAVERAYVDERLERQEVMPIIAIRQEIATLEAELEKERQAYAERTYLSFREQLFSTRKPVVGLSYVTSFFKVLDGGEVDADDDGLLDNEHQTKSRSLALTFDWRLGEENGLSILASRSTERASAEEGALDADFNGFGATWSHRLMVLNEGGYRKTKAYKESLFVPSIVFGLAYEHKECDSPDAECPDAILRTRALTPFFDFKINKGAQFRIGLPLQRKTLFVDGGTTEEDSVEVVSLFAVQLGKPN